MRRVAMYVLTMLVASPAALAGQIIDLTGAPAAALPDPFTQISGIRELSADRAIVIDAGERTVQMADFAKRSIASLGRRGSGPGEYQMPAVIFAAPNGATWLSDPQLAKVHIIGPDGKIGATLYTPGRDGPDDVLYPRGVDRLGRLYFESFGAPGPTTPDSVPVVRWSREGKRTDTMAFVPNGVIVAGGARTRKLYQPRDAWAVLPDGRVALIHAQPYRVDIVTAPGRVTRGPAVAYTPVPIGAAERDAYRVALRGGTGTGGARSGPVSGFSVNGPRPRAAAVEVSDDEFPATFPAFSGDGIRVTPEGEIWVPRYRPAKERTPTYDIFDDAGRLVGAAKLREHSSVVGFGAGSVYVARRDPEDDFRYLERYARRSGAAGRRP